MELQNLDHKLKMAIQNHQLLVTKMKNDPQNGALQKQLHELQSQIKGLSEKQKQVVQQLRKDLEIKQQHQPPKRNANLLKAVMPQASLSLTSSNPLEATVTKGTIAQLPAGGLIFPGGKLVVRPSSPTMTPAPTAVLIATTAATNGNGNIHHHHRSASSGAAAAILVRTSSCSSTYLAPAAPSPTDNHPPIRVPQYPIIQLVGGSGGASGGGGNGGFVIAAAHSTPSIKELTTTHVLPRVTPPPVNAVVTLLPSRPVDHPSTPPSPLRPSSIATKSLELHRPRPRLSDIDSAKAKFMTALGLVTHDILTELQNRKSERKRRTTANPQFSYHSWEHADKRSNMSYLSGCLPSGFKRPRGRPRVGSSTTPTGSRPSTPDDTAQHNGPSNGLPTKGPRNGIREDADFCQICREKDDLLNLVCDVCSHPCHSTCLVEKAAACNDEETTAPVDSSSPAAAASRPPSPFVCSRCRATKKKHHGWPRSLAAVHTYLAHKAAKEDEKLRLVKRNVELKAERSKLEQKAKQLSEALSQYVHKRNAVVSNTNDTVESIDRIKSFVRLLQSS